MKGQGPRPISLTGPELYEVFLTKPFLGETIRGLKLHATAATLLRVNKASYDAFTWAVGYDKVVVSESNTHTLLYGILNKRKRDLLSLCTHLQLLDDSLLLYWMLIVEKAEEVEESYGDILDKHIGAEGDSDDKMDGITDSTKNRVHKLSPFGNVTHLALGNDLPWMLVCQLGFDPLADQIRNSIVQLFSPKHLCVNYNHENLYQWRHGFPREAISRVKEMVDELLGCWSVKSLMCHDVTLEELPEPQYPPLDSIRISFAPVNEQLLEYVHQKKSRLCGANQRTSMLAHLCAVNYVDEGQGEERKWTRLEVIDAHHCLDPPTRQLWLLHKGALQTMDEFTTRLRDRLRPKWDEARYVDFKFDKRVWKATDEEKSKYGYIPLDQQVKITSRSEAAPCICCGRV